MGRPRSSFYYVIVLAVGGAIVLALSRLQPSSSGPWIDGHAVMPHAVFHNDSVTIHGFRRFRYRTADDYEAQYDSVSFDLNRIESLWYVVTPFSRDWRGPAHTFVSFGLSDSTFAAISVEARRELGEAYSTIKGLFRRYEVIYVVGDERDLIGLRVLRGEQTYVYPIRATPERIRALFVAMLQRSNELQASPEFYNTLTNNCTTNILAHVNQVVPEKIRFGLRILFPGYSDALAHARGWIDTELPLDSARERFLVSGRVDDTVDDITFSHRIRWSGIDSPPVAAPP